MNHLNHAIADLFAATCRSGKMDAPRLLNLGYLLMQTEGLAGDVVEMGCHKGETALFLQHLTNRQFWLYDSFKGLPPRGEHDIAAAQFQEGYFKCSRQECANRFDFLAPERRPKVIERWFDKLKPHELPEKVSFGHIDCDFYGSTKTALELLYYRLVPGAVCVVDDYSWPGLPGVKLAVDVFMKGRKEKLVHPTTIYYKAHQCWLVKL